MTEELPSPLPDNVSYKRKRNGVLATGYFNRIGLPGVRLLRDGTDEVELDTPWDRTQIHFDGDASQLFYPPDMYTIRDGVVYVKARDKDGNREFVRVGTTDSGGGLLPQMIPVFNNVEPAKTELQIKETADAALAAIQKEVDLWTRRFYVFAGGDFCANRSLVSQYFPSGPASLETDFADFPLATQRGERWTGLYARTVNFDLAANAFCNMTFMTGQRDQASGQVSLSLGVPECKVDLSRNRRLHFDIWLNSDCDPDVADIRVIVGNAGDGDSGQWQPEPDKFPFQITNQLKTMEFDIPPGVNLSAINSFLKLEMQLSDPNNTAKTYRFSVSNVWFEWTEPDASDARLFDKCWMKSWNTGVPDLHFDIILQNTCFVYDQTLAMYALLGAGDYKRALVLLRAMEYVINNDPEYPDARVRDAYKCGPAVPIPTDYPVSIPGWFGRLGWRTESAKEEDQPQAEAGDLDSYSQDAYAVSTWVGTAAWVMMAMLSAHRYFIRNPNTPVSEYVSPDLLPKAIALSEWVVDNFKVTTDYFKGFMGGFYGFSSVDYAGGENPAPRVPRGVYKTPSGQYEGPGQFILPWRSAEHAADLYAAFRHLYEITGDVKWADNMRHALEYIDKLWYDGPFDRSADGGPVYENMAIYLTGNGEIDEDFWWAPPNKANLPTDPTVWITYGTDRLDATRLRSLDFLHRNAREISGDPNSMWKYSVASNGGWIEGAGQVAVLFKTYGLPSWWLAALSPCVDHQLPTGIMYSVTETAATGFTLPNVGLQDQPWKYFRRGHMGATAWFLIGWYQVNPFKFPVDLMEGSQPQTDDRLKADVVMDMDVGRDLNIGRDAVVQNELEIKKAMFARDRARFNDEILVSGAATFFSTVDINAQVNIGDPQGDNRHYDLPQKITDILKRLDALESSQYRIYSNQVTGSNTSRAADFLAANNGKNTENQGSAEEIQSILYDQRIDDGVDVINANQVSVTTVSRQGDVVHVFTEMYFSGSRGSTLRFKCRAFERALGITAVPCAHRRGDYSHPTDISTENIQCYIGKDNNYGDYRWFTLHLPGGLERPAAVHFWGVIGEAGKTFLAQNADNPGEEKEPISENEDF